jgi:hypothetical protein
MAIIKLRRTPAQAEWVASTFILAAGEAGVALDTGEVRYGDGVNRWSALPGSTVGGLTDATTVGKALLKAADAVAARVVLGAQAIGSYAAAVHSHAVADVTGLTTALDAREVVVRWNSSTRTWGARPTGAAYGVLFLSSNDATADAPTAGLVGDLWGVHPDAA